jgi:hypothetical protein
MQVTKFTTNNKAHDEFYFYHRDRCACFVIVVTELARVLSVGFARCVTRAYHVVSL